MAEISSDISDVDQSAGAGGRQEQPDLLALKAAKFEFRRSVFVQEAPSSKKEANEYISFSQRSREAMTRFLERYVTNIHNEASSPDGKETLKAQPHAQELLNILGGEKENLDQQAMDKKIGEMLNMPDGWKLSKTLLEQETAMEIFAIGLMYQAEMTKAQEKARAGRVQTPEQAAQGRPTTEEPEKKNPWLSKFRKKHPEEIHELEELPDDANIGQRILHKIREHRDPDPNKSTLTGAIEGVTAGAIATSLATNPETYRDIAHAAANLGEWVYNLPPSMQGALLAGTTAAILGRRIGRGREQRTAEEQHQVFQQNINTLSSIKNDKNYAAYVKATIGIDVDDFDIVDKVVRDKNGEEKTEKVIEMVKHPKSTTSFTDILSGIEANIKTRDRCLQELGVPQSLRDSYPEMSIVEGEAQKYERTGERVNKKILDKFNDLGGMKVEADDWGNKPDSVLFGKMSNEEAEHLPLSFVGMERDANGRGQEDPLWGRGAGSPENLNLRFERGNITETTPRDIWGRQEGHLLYGRAAIQEIYYLESDRKTVRKPNEPGSPLRFDPLRNEFVYEERTPHTVTQTDLQLYDDVNNLVQRDINGNFIRQDGRRIDQILVHFQDRNHPRRTPLRYDQLTQQPDGTFSYETIHDRPLSERELIYRPTRTRLSEKMKENDKIEPYLRDQWGNSPKGLDEYEMKDPRYAHLYGVTHPYLDSARTLLEPVSADNFVARDKDNRAPNDPLFGINPTLAGELDPVPTNPDFSHFDQETGRDEWGQGPSSPYFCRVDGAPFQKARERSIKEDPSIITIDQWGQTADNPFFLKRDATEVPQQSSTESGAITRFRKAREFVLTDLTETVIDLMKAHPEPSVSLIEAEITAREEGGKIYEEKKKEIQKDLSIVQELQVGFNFTREALKNYDEAMQGSKKTEAELKQYVEETFNAQLEESEALDKIKSFLARENTEPIEIVLDNEAITIKPLSEQRKLLREQRDEDYERVRAEHPQKMNRQGQIIEHETIYLARIQPYLQEENNKYQEELSKITDQERKLYEIRAEIRSKQIAIKQGGISPDSDQAKERHTVLYTADPEEFKRAVAIAREINTHFHNNIANTSPSKILKVINELGAYGWPTTENDFPMHKQRLQYATALAQAMDLDEDTTNSIVNNSLIDALVTDGISQEEIETLSAQDLEIRVGARFNANQIQAEKDKLIRFAKVMTTATVQMREGLQRQERRIVSKGEHLNLEGEKAPFVIVKDLMKRHRLIPGLRKELMSDVSTYIPLKDEAVLQFEDLPFSEKERYTKEEKDFVSQYQKIETEKATNEYRQKLRAGVDTNQATQELDERIKNAAEAIPVGYFQLMNLLFDYQSKSGDDRAREFKNITEILPPSRLYEIIRDNPDLPTEITQNRANLNETLVALNNAIRNNRITTVDIRKLFTGIIGNVQARALAGNLALAA